MYQFGNGIVSNYNCIYTIYENELNAFCASKLTITWLSSNPWYLRIASAVTLTNSNEFRSCTTCVGPINSCIVDSKLFYQLNE